MTLIVTINQMTYLGLGDWTIFFKLEVVGNIKLLEKPCTGFSMMLFIGVLFASSSTDVF